MNRNVRHRPLRWLAALALATAGLTPLATASPAQAAPDACGTRIAKSTGGSWSCTFVDNFDGTSLDSRKWTTWTTANSGFTVAYDCYMQGDQYQAVRNGTLRLTATQASQPFYCKTPTGGWDTRYGSSEVTTYKKFNQAFGRFEARMKFPSTTASGLHSNFWLWPDVEKYGGWPNSGEIDVAEWFSGFANKAYPSLRYQGWTDADSGQNCNLANADGTFHTYGVEWTRTQMTFIYDGKPCFVRTWVPSSPLVLPQPFDTPFHMILTAGSDQNTWWNNVTDATPFPATTEVDWVKVWK